MYDLGSDLRNERDKLSKRLRDYRRYTILAGLVLVVGYALAIYLIFTHVNFQAEVEIGQLWVFSPIVVALLSNIILARLARPHILTTEEATSLKVYSALECLGNYLEDGREPDRKRAMKTVDKVAREIEKWNIGKLQLCKKVIGSSMGPFREAFNTRLVGAIQKGRKATFRVLTRF